MKWIALIGVLLIWTAESFAESGSRFTTTLEIDASLVMVGIALIALLLPFLYDGSLFTRQRVWKRRFSKSEYRTSRYYADRHGEVEGHRDRYESWRGVSSVRGEKPEKDEVRRKARRSL